MSSINYNVVKQIIKEGISSFSGLSGKEALHLKIIEEIINESIKPEIRKLDKVSDILANKIIKNYDKIEIILNSQDKEKVLSTIETIIDDYDESIDLCDVIPTYLRNASTYLKNLMKIKQEIIKLQRNKTPRNQAILKIMEDNIPYPFRKHCILESMLNKIAEIANKKSESMDEELEFCCRVLDQVGEFIIGVEPLLKHDHNAKVLFGMSSMIEAQIQITEALMEFQKDFKQRENYYYEENNDDYYHSSAVDSILKRIKKIADKKKQKTSNKFTFENTKPSLIQFVNSRINMLNTTVWNILTTRFVKCYYKNIIKL